MWQLLILILVILLVYTTARMKRDSKAKLDSPNTEMVKCNACDLHLPASEAIENISVLEVKLLAQKLLAQKLNVDLDFSM